MQSLSWRQKPDGGRTDGLVILCELYKSFLADMHDIAEEMEQWTMGQNQVVLRHLIIHIPVSLRLSK